MSPIWFTGRRVSVINWALLTIAVATCLSYPLVQAQEGAEFPGIVVTVDQATGKFAVKKDGGGTRFTFTANEKTKFSGAGLASFKDMKKDDHVLVIYKVQGPQYLALSVTKK